MTALEWAWLWLRGGVAVAGTVLIVATLVSAVKTFVVPRGVDVWLTSLVFRFVGAFFRFRARRASDFRQRDEIMVVFAPLTLLLLPVVLLTLVLLGYAALFWALDPTSIGGAIRLSGSSLLTLGYQAGPTGWHKLLEFSEAMLGLILVALLIAYLPAMYSGFARRETAVALLEGYAGSPPSPREMIARAYRTGELAGLRDFWLEWQTWFAEIEESHTSLAPLAFFRSPVPERSWITAAGCVLDTAALMLAAVDIPYEPRAAFCIRGGYLALRRIADFFQIAYDPDPEPGDPISISRSEFDQVLAEMDQAGVPLKSDPDAAWRAYAGWRVNYDVVLLQLATLTMAPYAPWSSDRSARQLRPGAWRAP